MNKETITKFLIAAIMLASGCAGKTSTPNTYDFGDGPAVRRNLDGSLVLDAQGKPQPLYGAMISEGGIKREGTVEFAKKAYTQLEFETGQVEWAGQLVTPNALYKALQTINLAVDTAFKLNGIFATWKALAIQGRMADAYEVIAKADRDTADAAAAGKLASVTNITATSTSDAASSSESSASARQNLTSNQYVEQNNWMQQFQEQAQKVQGDRQGHGHQNECQECGGWNGSSLKGETFLMNTPTGPVKFSFVTPAFG